jgi:hypothetical protein
MARCQDQLLADGLGRPSLQKQEKSGAWTTRTKNIWFITGQKWRNAKQAKVATKAQDVVVDDERMHKGLRNCTFAVRKDRRKQGVNTENIGQFSYDLLKNTLDTLW